MNVYGTSLPLKWGIALANKIQYDDIKTQFNRITMITLNENGEKDLLLSNGDFNSGGSVDGE